ncbi:cytochrome c biogenesis protein DipZ [Pseudomonas chlororaphis]|uniref:cytochrome c biogenesis protein DipZ n=1 Tax=Pseudomonas chlororaphis TaxID=587753 RepID=UPI0012322FE1|nr:cytochrome c biogenesis protein DipZ [Pseudomonas chlororaphis]KAA5844792.1 cytochrome c biogenesis protein DipZ [Pseudomonas chlororaphis]MBP5064975.1 cytochrome c biogenesis protein DipZ [Pseudomonas chlororaphis]QTT94367.1 cytochrome c biogenesis protein DipZ [Pseudomonas chlororaphis]WDG50834.1 cytochrome c biogenesis protein DipZ [Pseudomonas chlororaphis]
MLLIAFLGGVLTILSPCILPVVPFLFARADRSRGSVLLTLGGMALTFALVSSLAVVSSDWIVRANGIGRQLALVVLGLFALSLIFARFGNWLARPWVSLGNRLDGLRLDRARKFSGPLAALLLGVATGLLWAPCAGPILGVILTGAMLQGASAQTSLLLLAYGLGSALSLGLLIFAGRGLVNRLKPSLPATAWLRRAAGYLVLLAVVAIGSGVDDRLLASTSSQGGAALEQGLLKSVPKALDYLIDKAGAAPVETLPNKGPMPSLSGAVQWLNSPLLDAEALRGKVVLVDFWTYDCINCQHSLPYVNAWAKKYAKDGLVVIGVHTPEYAFEKVIDNVKAQVRKLDIGYPVAIDNDYAIWRAFDNQYWPAHYFIDARGQVRYSHFGEGSYEAQEQVIQQLLREAKAS